jgi:hypothetical protein
VAEQIVPVTPGKPTDCKLEFAIPAPRHDAHLVCVVLGDGVKERYWPTEEDYTLAATNPVWLDADGDGKFRSPRESAKMILAQSGKQVEKQWRAVAQTDDGIAIQMLDLMAKSMSDKSREAFLQKLQANVKDREIYAEILKIQR